MKKILITNDDGIRAKGIESLTEVLSELGEVYVVAPNTEKSACGHGITMRTPMIVEEVQIPYAAKAWTVTGLPADCVKLGIRMLVEDVDLVVSGTNHGANVGEDCFYSGTVAGGIEGIFSGKPSMAVSICSTDPKHFGPSMKIAKKLAKRVLEEGLEEGIMLNVNIPDLPEEEIKGVRVTQLGHVHYAENFRKEQSGYGDWYYWYNGVAEKLPQHPEADVQAIRDKYITVTPIQFDLTAQAYRKEIESWDIQL